MNSNEAKIVADFLIADLETEIQTTLHVLGAVPDGNLGYQPDEKSKTAIGLLRHLPIIDEWLLNSVADGAFSQPPEDSDACGIMTPADAVERYQTRVPAALGRVRAMSGEQLAAVIDFFGMMQMPAVNLLSMAVKHSIHHRGQLSTYLRAMGGKVPGIYGPSGDTE